MTSFKNTLGNISVYMNVAYLTIEGRGDTDARSKNQGKRTV